MNRIALAAAAALGIALAGLVAAPAHAEPYHPHCYAPIVGGDGTFGPTPEQYNEMCGPDGRSIFSVDPANCPVASMMFDCSDADQYGGN